MNNFLPLLTLVIGALLGLFSSLFASFIQHRRSIALRLLDQFLAVRKDLANAITPLTNINLDNNMPLERRIEYRDMVAELYYKHYDFLPSLVLDSLVRLQTCLDSPDQGPIAKQDNAIVPMSDSELPRFIDECSLLTNSKLFAPLALKSNNPIVRHNQAIKLHARHVLMTLNKYAAIDDLLKMVKSMKKKA